MLTGSASFVIACGSRSALVTTESVSGDGGSAGVAAFCADLPLSGSPVRFKLSESEALYTPKLAFSNSDHTRVAVIAPVLEPLLNAVYLRMTSFAAWDGWPTTLGTGARSEFVAGLDQFELDRGTAEDSLAIAWAMIAAPALPAPTGVMFEESVNATTASLVSTCCFAGSGGLDVDRVRVVRAAPDAHLVGIDSSTHDQHLLQFWYVAGGTAKQADFGCATDAMFADAAARPSGGFLFAFSSSSPSSACANAKSTDAPAHMILGGLAAGGKFTSTQLAIDEPDRVVRLVRVLPRSDGAWLVWQYDGLNTDALPVMVARLGPTGALLTEAIPILDGSIALDSGAVAPVGDGIALAWVDGTAPNNDVIHVRILGSSAQAVAERSYQTERSVISSRISLLASPNGDQLLLGWALDGHAETRPEVFVARLCLPRLK